ncbi:hypothetical protein ANCCEY_03325 [Ancylostoma ceylanicum]|uniref:Protein kinase domain-containing protein n=1 Tax=Ancylostoma ceylanicum TaxID=53326 RepID=A0A0D6MBB0_9BILA|nr:hypothetical protein ANCCEY_03325 [Ancylostoma ceylanicum]
MTETAPVIIQLEAGKLVDKYTVVKKLGEGTFGAVYALLRLELLVMQRLQEKHAIHMADLIDRGRFENFNYIIMKLLGKSLQSSAVHRAKLQVAKKTGPDQHLSLGPAIGDVKPGNFAVGRAETGDLRRLYILDFGMCRKFVDKDNVMLQPRKKAPFRGTPRYAAIASHLGKEHCRKDDIESWFYMLVDFTNAKLPWKGTTDIKDVGKIKMDSRQEPLLSEMMMLCPMEEYKQVLDHIDGLSFFDEPKYDLIYSILRGAMKRKGVSEFPYDWEKDALIST